MRSFHILSLICVLSVSFSQRTRPRPFAFRVRETTTRATTPGQGQGQDLTLDGLTSRARDLLIRNEALAAGFIRMIFHDCVGGCDGCIDLNSSDNAGLQPIVAEAQRFRTQNAPQLSQADVFALLAKVAAEFAVERAGRSISIPFLKGRRDCDGTQPQKAVPHGNRLDTIDFLTREFGLNATEAVALMGAHSVGRCNLRNSGFEGRWDARDLLMDNGFFQNLRTPGWITQRQNNQVVKSTQWVKQFSDFLMLHSDMVLLKTFTISGQFDEPSCSYDTCPSAPTAADVNKFADDEDLFHRTFQNAFSKMINGNGQGLTEF